MLQPAGLLLHWFGVAMDEVVFTFCDPSRGLEASETFRIQGCLLWHRLDPNEAQWGLVRPWLAV